MIEVAAGSGMWLSFGCTMVHLFWIGTVVGLFAWAGRVLLSGRGISLRYRFTLACMALLAVVPGVLFPAIEGQIHAPLTTPPVISRSPADASAPDSDADDIAEREWLARELTAAGAADMSPAADLQTLVQPARLAPILAWMSSRAPWLWVCGSGTMLLLTLGGLCGVRRLRRCAHLEKGAIQCRADVLCEAIGLSRVSVGLVENLESPVLIGWRRPLILLPATAAARWNGEQLDMVLMHELAHARRRDNLVTFAQRAIEVLFFFNPAVWYLSRGIRRDREEICDRFVLSLTGKPRAYAELLLGFAGAPMGCRLGTAMAEHDLVARIRTVLEANTPPRTSRRGIASAGLVLGLALLGSGAYQVLNAIPLPRAVPELASSTPTSNPVASAQPPALVPGSPASAPLATTVATPAAPETAAGTTFMLQDENGLAVVGAYGDVNVRMRDGLPLWESKTVGASDDRGLVCLPLAPGKGSTQFYFYSPELGLAGTALVKAAQPGVPIPVVLRATCPVQVELTAPGSSPLTWTKAFVRMAGDECPDTMLRQTRSVGPWQYRFELPPGRYELVVFGGNEESSKPQTAVGVHCFDVVAGQSTLDLGKIALGMKPATGPQKSKPAVTAGGAVAGG